MTWQRNFPAKITNFSLFFFKPRSKIRFLFTLCFNFNGCRSVIRQNAAYLAPHRSQSASTHTRFESVSICRFFRRRKKIRIEEIWRLKWALLFTLSYVYIVRRLSASHFVKSWQPNIMDHLRFLSTLVKSSSLPSSDTCKE